MLFFSGRHPRVEQVSQRASVLYILRSFEHQSWESVEPRGSVFSVVSLRQSCWQKPGQQTFNIFSTGIYPYWKQETLLLPEEAVMKALKALNSFTLQLLHFDNSQDRAFTSTFFCGCPDETENSTTVLTGSALSLNSLNFRRIFKSKILHIRMHFDALGYIGISKHHLCGTIQLDDEWRLAG